jgi:hypothetical protein
LLEQLARYDDEAWAALANRGLVRRARKDLEGTEPTMTDTGDSVVVQLGPQTVTFDAAGPQHASCSCPSAVACHHLVAAGIWLARQAVPAAPDVSAPSVDHDAAPTAAPLPVGEESLHAELMALTMAELVAHAGKAGHRWAHQYAADADLVEDVSITSARRIQVTLSSPRVTFRYMGGGVASLVPDARLPALEKYQVAVALLYQRAHGAEPEAPTPLAGRHPADDSLGDSRTRLRDTTARLLTDVVRLGLSHLSPGVHERFETVAVWAQGASYPRLALLLRRLANQVELLLARSAEADEQRLLDDVALAFALVHALDVAAGQGATPAHLVGTARNRYDLVRRLEVVGLGSLPWRSGSGYHGLTTLFWWPEEQRFVSLTDARPETVRGWDPRSRHSASGPWQGLVSPAAATGAAVTLTSAQLSASGRLSGVESTQALVTALDGADLVASLPVVTRWQSLERPLRERAGLLSVPDPLRDWAVLQPTEFETTHFDPVHQRLIWTLRDTVGDPVTLRVGYTSYTAPAIRSLEALTPADLDGALVVCRLALSRDGLVGEPLSLVRPGRSSPEHPVLSLYFTEPYFSETSAASGAPARTATPSAGQTRSAPFAPASLLPRELVDLRSWVVATAERGTGATTGAGLVATLEQHHARLRSVGLTAYPATVAHADAAEQLLRSHFLTLQVGALLLGHSDD